MLKYTALYCIQTHLPDLCQRHTGEWTAVVRQSFSTSVADVADCWNNYDDLATRKREHHCRCHWCPMLRSLSLRCWIYHRQLKMSDNCPQVIMSDN